MLEKTLKGSRALDTEGLCIVAGKMVYLWRDDSLPRHNCSSETNLARPRKQVWAVRVDVHVLDYDGNMLDAASIAAITALLHFRRPDTTVVGEEVTIHTLTSRNPVPLSIHHIPICCTFALLGPDGDLCIMDPTLLEEQVQSGRMTISMNNYRELCGLAKPGGVPVDMDRIAQCCELAHGKTTEIIERIQALLKEDQQRRESKVGGLMARKPREGARVPGG